MQWHTVSPFLLAASEPEPIWFLGSHSSRMSSSQFACCKILSAAVKIVEMEHRSRIFSILNTSQYHSDVFVVGISLPNRPRHGSPLLSWSSLVRVACFGIGVPTTLHIGS